MQRPIIHRGLHNIFDGVIEQSRESIRRAIAAGLPIEVDIENSIDDRSFVIHDPTLDKLTNGRGRLRSLTAQEIRSYSLHCTQGEPIMYLEELLDLVDGQVPLIFEFKNRELAIPPAITEAARILSHYRGTFAVTSFSPILMEWFRDHYPRFTRGLVTSDTDTLEARDHFIVCMLRNRMDLDFIVHQWCQINCWTFQWIVEQDLPILMWTIRDGDDWNVAKAFADNILFEFIAPDKDDWRKHATVNWRAELGEKVDRRFCKNQPANLKHDSFKGSTPWWARNRRWAPVLTPKPPPPGVETGASYDSTLIALSVFENKREIYKSDAHFRSAWNDWKGEFPGDAVQKAVEAALVLLRPEGTLRNQGTAVLEFLAKHGFEAAASFQVPVDRNACHELMRHQWANAGLTAVDLELERLMLCPLVGILLNDREPEVGVPASVRLWGLLSALPANAPAHAPPVGRFVVAADEPADLIRHLGVLLRQPARRRLFGELKSGHPPDALRPATGDGQTATFEEEAAVAALDRLEAAAAKVQAKLPDRAAPFDALHPSVARTLWRSRGT